MMDTPIAACIIAGCLLAGGLAGGVEQMHDHMFYEGFLNDPGNYHLVDDTGHPVSQETK